MDASLHIIVGEPGTADEFWRIYDETRGKVHYYVALPYMAAGRAKPVDVGPEWVRFMERAAERQPHDLSLGALFYPFLLERPDLADAVGVSIYEPEVLSGYRILDDSYRLLRRSSYDLRPKFEDEA